jgi:hypothetical protein
MLLLLRPATLQHPHLERVQQDAAANRHENIHALPDMDPTRPHVFIDVAVDNKPAGVCCGCCVVLWVLWVCVLADLLCPRPLFPAALGCAAGRPAQPTSRCTMSWALSCLHTGRLVIEIFEDAAPAAARHLLNRFMHGSAASVSGAPFHKLLPGYALYGGRRCVRVCVCVSLCGVWCGEVVSRLRRQPSTQLPATDTAHTSPAC